MAITITPISEGKTEAQRAAELKAEIAELLKPILGKMQEASLLGLRVSWDGIAPNQFGQFQVNNLRLEKHY